MRKSTCVQLFEKYLGEVSKGHGYREHENPAIQFSKNAKSGKYNSLSDECYEIILQETKDISALWLNQSKQDATDILRFALENINIDKNSLRKLAEILADCYSVSVNSFLSEDTVYELENTENDFNFDKCFSDIISPEENSLSFQESFCRGSTDSSLCDEIDKEESMGCSLYEEFNCEGDNIGAPHLSSPSGIYTWLSKYIYGQEKAVMAASMLLYNHTHGRKRNILFIGQTGSGKTEIWRVCKHLYPGVRIIDSTMITGEGWTGSFKVNDVFNGMSKQEAEHAIIVFDEFDKLCEPQIGSGGTNHSLLLQNGLLKLIEGTTITLQKDKKDTSKAGSVKIDTSKVSFVFCGSFERLTEMKTRSEAEQSIGFGGKPGKKEARLVYEDVLQPADLVKYAGVRQEIAGRINQIVQLSPMTAEAYREILKDLRMSPLHQLERQYGVKLCLDVNTEQKLVREAEETHMGVRYLRSRIQQMLDEQMFQDCGRKEYKLSA